MNFLKWLYLDVYIPCNFYFSVLYSQVAQLKFLLEIMALVGLGYFYLFGTTLSHKQIIVVFLGIFLLGIGLGYGLVKLGVPQKGNKMSNEVNPQLVEILDRIKKIEQKL